MVPLSCELNRYRYDSFGTIYDQSRLFVVEWQLVQLSGNDSILCLKINTHFGMMVDTY